MNSMIITSDGATLFIQSKPYMIGTDHPRYHDILDAGRTGNWDTIPKMIDIVKVIENSIIETGNPNLKIKDNRIVYKHITFPDDLSQYVINMIRDKFDLTPIVLFMEKLLKNPDHRVFQQLFGFLMYGKNPLTPNGNFLAYKKVKEDFTSVHDGKTMHKIGAMVEMQRDQCNANPEETCSTGLHFCSREYLANFGGSKILVLEINPIDVVSIPVDYNNTKGRACQYKVVGELSDFEKSKVTNEDVIKTATVEDKYDEIDNEKYCLGYKHGKNKLEKISDDVSYLSGYRDGRGKKKRKVFDDYKIETPEEEYRRGYDEGKKKLEATSKSDVYLMGYKDGRGKKKKQF